jgi:hypothetical protein
MDSVRSYLINELVAAHGRNQRAVVRKFHYYQGAIVALTVETAVGVRADFERRLRHWSGKGRIGKALEAPFLLVLEAELVGPDDAGV